MSWVERLPYASEGQYTVVEVERDWQISNGLVITKRVLASCPTYEAAEAAARLLSDFAPIGK